MPAHRSTQQQFVLSYLRQLGIAPSRSMNQFLQELATRHGPATARQLERIMADRASGNPGEDLYAVKNQTLPLSLDFARFSADLYRRLCDWLMAWPDVRSARVILDVGCDNGVMTCFLAQLVPNADVVGVDQSEDAIRCAQELATRLHLTNVRFICADAQQSPLTWVAERSCDVVVSVRSAHAMDPRPFPWRYWSLQDLTAQFTARPTELRHGRVLDVVSRVLEPKHGRFLTVERLTTAGEVLEWCWAMQQAGFTMQWTAADWLEFHEVGVAQRMPILPVAIGAGADLEDQARAFLDAAPLPPLRIGDTFTDVRAERALFAANERHFLQGLELCYPAEAGLERYELWVCQDLLLMYRTSNLGYRELKVLGTGAIAESGVELSRLATVHQDIGTMERYGLPR